VPKTAKELVNFIVFMAVTVHNEARYIRQPVF